jgi:hypothetical protein
MAPCPDAEVTAFAPPNFLLSTWSVGSSVTEKEISFVSKTRAVYPPVGLHLIFEISSSRN